MSRASGQVSSSARIAASESAQLSSTASPWRSACVTPGRSSSSTSAASGSVARIVRPPTIARISVVGPSATTRPRGHQDRAVGVGVGLLEVVGGEEDRAARARRTRASSLQKAWRPSTSIAVVGSSSTSSAGSLDEREREAHALRLAAGQLLRPPVGDRLDARPARAPRRRRAARGTATRPSRRARAPDRSWISMPVWSIAPTGRRSDRVGGRVGRTRTRCRRRARRGRAACRSWSTCRRRWGRAARRSRRRRIGMSTPRTASTVAVRRLEGLLEAAELDAAGGRLFRSSVISMEMVRAAAARR